MLKSLRKGSHSPGSPEQLIIEQLCKSAETSMYTAALIACTNESLLTTNTRLTRKQGKKRQYIASGEVLTGEEGAVLANGTGSAKAKKKPNRVTKPKKEKQSAVRSNSGFLNWV
jgi:glutamyl/glutaminyl-tRNA synthetase